MELFDDYLNSAGLEVVVVIRPEWNTSLNLLIDVGIPFIRAGDGECHYWAVPCLLIRRLIKKEKLDVVR